jgi:hypothetical protein
MLKYEYKVLKVHYKGGLEPLPKVVQVDDETVGKISLVGSMKGGILLHKYLNQLGSVGWEVCSQTQGTAESAHTPFGFVILKRAIS